MSSVSDRYVEQVMERVLAPAVRIESLRADLDSHFVAAADHGESEQEVIRRLGPPAEVAASFMADVELSYAGFWERLVAFVGDIGLCALVIVPLFVACGLLGPGLTLGADVASFVVLGILLMAGLSLSGVLLLYFPLLEHFYGKTFGKHVLGLRVISESGGPITFGAALLRRLSYYFKILWLDALFVPFTEKKQRAFDIVAKTVVVHEPDRQRGLGGWLLCLAPWVVVALVGAGAALLFSH